MSLHNSQLLMSRARQPEKRRKTTPSFCMLLFGPEEKTKLADGARNVIMLDVSNLRISFGSRQPVRALDGVGISVSEGEILGLVGESGSGKTVLSLALLGLVGPTGRVLDGEVRWLGRNLLDLPERDIRRLRGSEVSMIFQNPQASLNPARTVGAQFRALLRLHHGITGVESAGEARRLLREVGVPDPERVMESYAFQLSPGMCQRVMIAMAISCRPKLLIADEPTASLDATIQAQIMDLLLNLRDRLGMAILLVSHDLGVVARLCDRVAVMYLGRIVEVANAETLYSAPLHPYTQALLRSVPVPDPRMRQKMQILAGDPPDPRHIEENACRFRGRCPVAVEQCAHVDPKLSFIGQSAHAVACVRAVNVSLH